MLSPSFTLPRYNLEVLQKVLDHWYLGRIQEVETFDLYYQVTTSQGVFIVFPHLVKECLNHDQTKWHKHQEDINEVLTALKKKNQVDQLLLKNRLDKFDEAYSTIHYGKWHYTVYKISPTHINENKSQTLLI